VLTQSGMNLSSCTCFLPLSPSHYHDVHFVYPSSSNAGPGASASISIFQVSTKEPIAVATVFLKEEYFLDGHIPTGK